MLPEISCKYALRTSNDGIFSSKKISNAIKIKLSISKVAIIQIAPALMYGPKVVQYIINVELDYAFEVWAFFVLFCFSFFFEDV